MTYPPADLVAVQHYVRDRTGLPWDALGIIHGSPQGGGYHEGHDLLHAAGRAPEDPGSDYSYAESLRDRHGLTDAGSAFDMGDGFGRFREITLGIVSACQRNDPRTRDVREVIYTPDGVTVRRFDRLGIRSSGDSSHLTHTHTSFFRDAEGRRDRADNYLGLLRELFEGVVDDMLDYSQQVPDGPARQGNPGRTVGQWIGDVWHETFGVPAKLDALATKLAEVDGKVGAAAAVSLSDADRAAIVTALAGLVPTPPTAAQIATAVLDEQHRRDAA